MEPVVDDEQQPEPDEATVLEQDLEQVLEQSEDEEIARILHRQQRRRRSMLGAAMVGLHDAIYGPQEQKIVIMASNDGMPEPDFDVQLTPDPRDSVVIMRKRRWRQRD